MRTSPLTAGIPGPQAVKFPAGRRMATDPRGRAALDPNALLGNLIELTNKVVNDTEESEDAIYLAASVLDLDGWMTLGGFQPRGWAQRS